jgi:hypothetical protein
MRTCGVGVFWYLQKWCHSERCWRDDNATFLDAHVPWLGDNNVLAYPLAAVFKCRHHKKQLCVPANLTVGNRLCAHLWCWRSLESVVPQWVLLA